MLPMMLWLLLSDELASFLAACLRRGRLPACISFALVSSLQKTGEAAADPGQIRCIAAGKPLHELHAVIDLTD